MTLLVASVFGDSPDGLRRQVDAAIDGGADAVEIRWDLCDGVSADDIRQWRNSGHPAVPVILTIRSRSEGGAWDGDDTERLSRFIDAGPSVDFLDVELATWRRSANIRQKVKLALQRAGHISQAGGIEEIEQAARRRLILSTHDNTTRPATLHADLLEMARDPECHVVKIAWRARTVRDNFEALEVIRTSPKPTIALCMGEDGLASRVLSRKFGAFATFATAETGRETAPGQITLQEMTERYRWNAIDADTRLFGLIGDPVGRSLSPAIHNAGFQAAGINAVYLPFRVGASYESFKAFMVEALARSWLDVGGFSVTLPHKENALRFVTEHGGRIDPLSQKIGAANTLSVGADGGLTAFNTDASAAMDALCALAACQVQDWAGRAAVVLGAGGVARAVIAALIEAGANVTVVNRTPQRAKAVAQQFACRHIPWNERHDCRASVLVNCTSLGMPPQQDLSPMPADCLKHFDMVLDTVYHPRPTRLVREATEQQIHAADGLRMFIQQGASQFQIWTGRVAPAEALQKAVDESLTA